MAQETRSGWSRKRVTIEAAGAFSVVLELVPTAVAKAVTAAVQIPTIGIGAGVECDGQVLVLHDCSVSTIDSGRSFCDGMRSFAATCAPR